MYLISYVAINFVYNYTLYKKDKILDYLFAAFIIQKALFSTKKRTFVPILDEKQCFSGQILQLIF